MAAWNAEALETFAVSTRQSLELLQSAVRSLHDELRSATDKHASDLRQAHKLLVAALTAAVLAFGLAAYALAGA
jgi:hypothetical protein